MNREHDEVKASPLKVKFQVKMAALVLSILSLSWFFEGVRNLKQSPDLTHIVFLVFPVVLTLFLLWVQAYWIYIEEKSKGSLKKTVVHFDRIEEWLNSRAVDKDKKA
jgi:hypothetical protein